MSTSFLEAAAEREATRCPPKLNVDGAAVEYEETGDDADALAAALAEVRLLHAAAVATDDHAADDDEEIEEEPSQKWCTRCRLISLGVVAFALTAAMTYIGALRAKDKRAKDLLNFREALKSSKDYLQSTHAFSGVGGRG